MTHLPVSAKSGTDSWRHYLYGLEPGSEALLGKLLQHMYCQVRKTPMGNNSESLRSVGLTLCGWRVRSRSVAHGRTVSGLHRAILQEEGELVEARAEARERGVDLANGVGGAVRRFQAAGPGAAPTSPWPWAERRLLMEKLRNT